MTSFILMAAMGGGGGAGSLIPNVELPGVFDMCRAKPEAPDEKFVNAPPPQEGPLYLRMLFLSGTDLAAGNEGLKRAPEGIVMSFVESVLR